MSTNKKHVSEPLKMFATEMFLNHLKNSPTVNSDELSLFDWYVRETEELIAGMLSAEYAYIQENVNIGNEDINDSGIIAVEYYLKMVRYSHVIYMTSLLESFLENSCKKLTNIIGEENLPFNIGDLKGDQWSIKRKFLERYGKFKIPENIWSDINTLTLLRNNFIHDNGNTSELKPNERTNLGKQPWVNLNGYEIVIESEYIYSAFKAIKSLIQFIENRLVEITNRAIRPKIV